MFQFHRVSTTGFLFAFLLLVAWTAGCGNDAVPKESGITAPAAALPSATGLSALETADSADNQTDKVVSKCTMCKLGMEGKPEHTVSYGEYTLLFCSDHCKTSFEKDPETALLSLN